MKQNRPVVAWIVDDTGFVKKGTHSVGVARQYCGQVGKQENCRVAVSLSVSTHHASLPIAWRLYLRESWASDQERRKETGIPNEIRFQTKSVIALARIRQAVEQGVAPRPFWQMPLMVTTARFGKASPNWACAMRSASTRT